MTKDEAISELQNIAYDFINFLAMFNEEEERSSKIEQKLLEIEEVLKL